MREPFFWENTPSKANSDRARPPPRSAAGAVNDDPPPSKANSDRARPPPRSAAGAVMAVPALTRTEDSDYVCTHAARKLLKNDPHRPPSCLPPIWFVSCSVVPLRMIRYATANAIHQRHHRAQADKARLRLAGSGRETISLPGRCRRQLQKRTAGVSAWEALLHAQCAQHRRCIHQ